MQFDIDVWKPAAYLKLCAQDSWPSPEDCRRLGFEALIHFGQAWHALRASGSWYDHDREAIVVQAFGFPRDVRLSREGTALVLNSFCRMLLTRYGASGVTPRVSSRRASARKPRRRTRGGLFGRLKTRSVSAASANQRCFVNGSSSRLRFIARVRRRRLRSAASKPTARGSKPSARSSRSALQPSQPPRLTWSVWQRKPRVRRLRYVSRYFGPPASVS
jgi:hypothetical protein